MSTFSLVGLCCHSQDMSLDEMRALMARYQWCTEGTLREYMRHDQWVYTVAEPAPWVQSTTKRLSDLDYDIGCFKLTGNRLLETTALEAIAKLKSENTPHLRWKVYRLEQRFVRAQLIWA